MMSDGSYHEQEILDEANLRIDNFLVEHNYKVEQKDIDEFIGQNINEFKPYLDASDVVGIIQGKINI